MPNTNMTNMTSESLVWFARIKVVARVQPVPVEGVGQGVGHLAIDRVLHLRSIESNDQYAVDFLACVAGPYRAEPLD